MMVGVLLFVVAVLVIFAAAAMRIFFALASRSPDAEVLKHYTVLVRYVLLALAALSVALVNRDIDAGMLLESLSEGALGEP